MTSSELRYRHFFEPSTANRPQSESRTRATGFGDRREAAGYVYTDHITLAINVALATARPLLVRGAAGSGKSSLAVDVARRNGWDLYAEVVSSRTRAQDLLWEFDAVQRLRDAQAQLPVEDPAAYVRPGILWHAFDPLGARAYAGDAAREPSDGAVVLIDEIDKSDPDTPNDLLIPLGSGGFRVSDLKIDVTYSRPSRPLVFITTNEERELAPAFVRRCVVLQLPEPQRDWLVSVAMEHFGTDDDGLYGEVADYVVESRKRANAAGAQPPSTAEYLDALAACRQLDAKPGDMVWNYIAVTTLEKWIGEPSREVS
jgi:MoxR-like ATPase